MEKFLTIFVLAALVPVLAACGSSAESDLDKSPEELREKAASMSKAEIEQAVADLEALAEEWGEETQAIGAEGMTREKMEEVAGRMGKLMQAMLIYQTELQKKR